jgi:hypothetical protein
MCRDITFHGESTSIGKKKMFDCLATKSTTTTCIFMK